jgi:hypothetical protein
MLKELLKQFPFIYPLKFISTKEYINKRKEKTSFYSKTRTFEVFLLENSCYISLQNPKSLNKTKNAPFISNYSYKTTDKFLHKLSNCYIYGNKGITLTRENFILDDLTHNFNISSLKKQIYKKPFLTFSTKVQLIDGVVASLLCPVYNNYYHFLLDLILRLKYYEESDGLIDFYLIPEDLDEKFSSFLSDLVGSNKILKIKRDKKYKISQFLVSSLTGSEGRLILDDILYLRRKLKLNQISANKKNIYLSRGGEVARKIINENAFINLLKSYDFIEVDPSKLTILEQLTLLGNAENVVAPHGAALTNIITMPKGSNLVEIFSEDYFRTDCFYSMAALQNINYHYWVGTRDKEWGDITINLEDFENLFLTKLKN